MRTAIEEIKFRADNNIIWGNIEPAEHLSDQSKAWNYRSCAGFHLGAYIYYASLNENTIALDSLSKSIEFGLSATAAYEQESLLSLETVYIGKAFLGEDLTAVSESIMENANQYKNESVNPLYPLLAAIMLGQVHSEFMPKLAACEKKKYPITLPGSFNAIEQICQNDGDALTNSISDMLALHHKKANNRHSDIYNHHASFISYTPYLLLNLARTRGLDISDNVQNRVQTLKLGMSSPVDFPDVPKNHKMPIEVDYLTGKIKPLS
ncbi:hypothetical protein ACFSJY_14150 [Thalassotalea euphylliae]|uniref:hypothetical protein n=1 Tax=Thalassotalea euphylliae TaxID=1655234 RepID=UPI0036393419